MLIILGCFIFCLLLENIFPGWKLKKIKSWPIRTLFLNSLQIAVVILAGVTWEIFFSSYSLFNLSSHVSDLAGGAIAYFIATFIFYWWHRIRHESDFLWKIFHQIHHSPSRLEVITSFYKHPLEMIVNSIIGSILVYAFLGLSLEASAFYTLLTALGEFVYHTNIKTPQWLGYVFQRPEMHRIHHQHGHHRNNYGDIVWWDMLFGTYENPSTWNSQCGFEDGMEENLIGMLKFDDLYKKKNRSTSVVLIIGLLLSFSSQVEACSVIQTKNELGEMIVAKNFDWISSEGMIVKNPRGKVRKSLNQSKSWISKYKSLSFTTLGPGLPVSSMNENGLVVEALVDFDSSIIQTNYNLSSLGWAQYVLDNYSTLNEVIEFAKNNPFNQIVVPLHFFICDEKMNCAVFEIRGKNNEKLNITYGNELNIPALANRGYKSDYFLATTGLKYGALSILNPVSSPSRFQKISSGNFTNKNNHTEDIFDQLEKSKISGINMWQIIWNTEQKSVQWKRKWSFGTKKYDLNSLPDKCTNHDQIKKLEAFSEFREYSKNDLEDVRSRVEKVSQWRLKSKNKQLADKIARFTLNSQCQVN